MRHTVSRALWLCLGSSVLVIAPAQAATATATMFVRGNTGGSVTVTIAAPGFTVPNVDTVAASVSLVSISRYGTAPSGWTAGTISGGWKLTTPVTVKTSQLLTGTLQATLSAKVNSTQSGVTWKVDSTALSTTDSSVATEVYGTHVHNLSIEIDNSAPSGTLVNVVTLTIVSQ